MQIVIELSEEDFEKNKNARCDYHTLRMAIKNGIPLPKGHGRVGDLDKALVLINQQIDTHDKMLSKYEPYRNTQIPSWMWEGAICQQLTIIEADKE